MESLPQFVKAAICFSIVLGVLLITGANEDSTKMNLLCVMYFLTFVFYFLDDDMDVIAFAAKSFTHLHDRRRETPKNNHPTSVWRFFAWILFVLSGIAWIFW